ncbi:MAG: radical SAM protein [Acidobacteriota bacterium]|nr:radical SAM protein [Acidobacteriota bacterium]
MSRPLEVILDTTERCNLKCKMCYFSAVDRLQFLPFDRQLSRNGMMPLETFSRVAADLFPRARKVALGCAAEPLVHPKFIDIVREAGSYGVPDLWFPTNLLPLTPAKAEAICEAGVNTVGVSMDGTSAGTYEAIRVGGKFDRLMRSLDLLNDVRRGAATRLRLIFVWMRTNRGDLADLPRFAEEVGASELDVRFVAPTAHVSAEDELLDDEDPGALRAELAAAAEDAAARGLRLVSYPDFDNGQPIGLRGHLMRWRAGLYDRQRLRGRFRTAVAGCAWPGHTVVVRPNGAVSPCIFWEEQPIGLYPETSLGEVERAPLLAEIVDGLKSGNPCGTCRTCSERKHALYFRLQWRQQAGERLEQLGAGPGSGGVAEGLQKSGRPSAGDLSPPSAGAGQKAGAPTPGAPTPGAPTGLPGPTEWIAEHTPAEPHDRVLLVGDEAWAHHLLNAGFAKQVDVVTSSAGAPAFWPASGAMPRSGEPEPPSSEPEPHIRRLPIHPRRPVLPVAAYQAVCCIGGLSSHLRLERLLDALLGALEPGGRLFVDDYVGPARHQWSRRTGAAAAAAYGRLPAAVRRFERLPMPPVEGDCARATRSGDIARLVRTGFRVESVRPYGGDLIAPLATSVDWGRLPEADLERLVAGSGAGDGHYALTVARPRTGWPRRLAGMQYRIGPKIRRVFIYEPRRARDLAFQVLRGKV